MAALVLLVMCGLVAINVPIAFTLLMAAVFGMAAKGYSSFNSVPIMLFDGANSFPLMAIPLFIMMGEIMNRTDLSARILNLANAMVGFIKGGLAMVSVVACMFFAELSGSAVAGAAALGSVLIPQMEKRGYPKDFAAAVVSSAATLAIIIPPSTSLILYGVIASVSIPKLFLAGFLPGILTAAGLMVVSYIIARKENYPVENHFSVKNLIIALKEGIWALLIPLIILGGIFLGIFTPTEAAAVAVVITMGLGWKKLKLADLPQIMAKTAKQTAVVTIIVATSTLLGWFFTSEQVPQQIAKLVTEITDNKYVVLLILNFMLLFLGCILHGSAAIVMTTPLMLPLITRLGIDPIHFGLIMTLNLGIGQQTPPVASVLLTTCAIAKLPIIEVWGKLKYFLLASLIVLLLVTYIPAISLFLPQLLSK